MIVAVAVVRRAERENVTESRRGKRIGVRDGCRVGNEVK